MPPDFSLFADDMVIEILGYLSALDIIRYRRVCRRIFQASQERCVWVNVFWRTKCALPSICLDNTSTQQLERILVRAELMDASWTGVRSVISEARRTASARDRFSYVGSMGCFAVVVRHLSDEVIFTWCQEEALDNPSLEYRIPASRFLQDMIYRLELGSNVFHLAYVFGEEHSRFTSFKHLKIVSFKISEISSTPYVDFEHIIPLRAPITQTPRLLIHDGYLILQDHPGSSAVQLFHIVTGNGGRFMLEQTDIVPDADQLDRKSVV